MRTRAGIGDGQFFLLQVLLSAVVAVGELPTGYLTDRATGLTIAYVDAATGTIRPFAAD